MSTIAKLHHAVVEDDTNDVSLLIENGANVNMVFQQETAFTRAVGGRHFKAADVIIASKDFDPNAKNQFDRSPLFMAAKEGQVDFVKKLLDMGAGVNDADIRGNTPLSACAWGDRNEAAEVLIQHGANVNQPDSQGQTPLFRACSSVSKNVVRLLLNHKCNVNQATTDKKTPLMAALPSYYNYHVAGKKISDMLNICEMLIEAGCNLDSQDDRGRTALHLAVESDDVYGLCLLAENGCELNPKNNQGYTPFQTAILPKTCRYDIARYLLYYGADITQAMQNPDMPNSELLHPLSLILNSKVGPEEMEKQWSRALLLRSMWRSIYPNQSLVKDHRSNPKMLDSSLSRSEDLPFHEAVERDVLDWLNSCIPCSLQHQATLKVRGILGSTNIIPKINLLPIGFGLKQNLSLGLRPDQVPLSQTCHLHLHIKDGDNKKVKDIIDSGTDVNIPVNNKMPLALALEIGNIEAAKLILKSHQKPQSAIVDASGNTALHIAAKHGRGEAVDDIIDVYSDIDSTNHKDLSPLQAAAMAGHFTIAKVLIEKGANPSVACKDGLPLLHLAAASGDADVVRLLLERGVDPNMQDRFGNTPLHLAASKVGNL